MDKRDEDPYSCWPRGARPPQPQCTGRTLWGAPKSWPLTPCWSRTKGDRQQRDLGGEHPKHALKYLPCSDLWEGGEGALGYPQALNKKINQ